MKLKDRARLLGFGAIVIGYGAWELHRGQLSYSNYYHLPIFSPGVIAIGVFSCLLAFLPPSKWIYPLITTKKRNVKPR